MISFFGVQTRRSDESVVQSMTSTNVIVGGRSPKPLNLALFGAMPMFTVFMKLLALNPKRAQNRYQYVRTGENRTMSQRIVGCALITFLWNVYHFCIRWVYSTTKLLNTELRSLN